MQLVVQNLFSIGCNCILIVLGGYADASERYAASIVWFEYEYW